MQDQQEAETIQEQRLEKRKFSPENNQYFLRQSQEQRQAMYIAKLYLKKFEEVQMHAVGEAINLSVKVAEMLQRHQLATVLKVATFQVELGDNLDKRKKLKMVIHVKRTPKFTATLDNN